MKRVLIVVTTLLVVSGMLLAAPNAQERLRMERELQNEQMMDRDPSPSYQQTAIPTDDIFDLIDHFPVGVGGGEYSVTTDGDHIYTAAWNSTGFYRYETDGTYIGEFTIAGAGNLRDLTYDGEYFYGSPNSTTIYELDLDGESLISSFTTTATASVRGIAYDPDHDGFWVTNGWDPPLTLIDRTGTTISTINPTASSFSGLGWENVTPDGPHLWAYTQELGTNQNNLVQMDISNGSTVQTFDVTTTGVLAGDAISGGMDITDELVAGKWTFIGTSQNDVIWIIELGDAADPEAPAMPTDFVVTPDAGGALEANLSWTNPDTQVNGDPLTELTAVHVYRGEDIVYTDNNPTIGGTDNYTDTVTESGLYAYQVVGENSHGEGIPAAENAWVGEDVPAAVEDLTLSQPNPDVLEAQLTWENPTEGLHGGAFNEPIIGYTIVRSDGEEFDITGINTSFTDDTIPAAGTYYYEVTAYNSIGDGGTAVSNAVLISDAGLLVMEDFSGAWPPAGWDVTSTGNINWEQNASNNAGGEAPEARFYWSPSTLATQRLITMPLDTSGFEEIIVEFRQYNNNFGGGYTLALQTSTDGNDWTTVETFPASDFGPQLDEITVDNDDVGSSTLYVAWMFDGDSWDINWWCIDDVMIVGVGDPPDTGSIEGNVTLDDGPGDVTMVEVTAGNVTVNPDASGDYVIDISPGTYDVTASLEGYESETIEDVVVQEGQATTGIDFVLTYLPPPPPPAPENVEIDEYEGILSWDPPAGPDLHQLSYHNNIPENAYFQQYDYGYGVVFDVSGYSDVTVEYTDYRHSTWGIFGEWDYQIHVVNWDTYELMHTTDVLQTEVNDGWETDIELGSLPASGLVGIFLEPMGNAPDDAYPCLDSDAQPTDSSYFGPLPNYSGMNLNSADVGNFLMDLWIMGNPTRGGERQLVKAPEFENNIEHRIRRSVNVHHFSEPSEQTSTTLRTDPDSYNVYLDGALVANVTETSYQYEDLVHGEEYVAGVSAVYDGEESEIIEVEFEYTGVSADDPIITKTQLHTNYPNPFNPETTISFSMNTPGRVEIDIYNIKGEKVRTLTREDYPAGNHTVVWDGRDNQNRTVASGVYMYRMSTENYSSTKKMILMK